MADYRKGLHLIPAHMHESVAMWIERAEPHPQMMGSFFGALLENNLMNAAANADTENSAALFNWAMFLFNYAPMGSYGSREKIDAYYAAHHEQQEASDACRT